MAGPAHWAEIGAGTGTFVAALAAHLPAGSTVYALDKSPHVLWQEFGRHTGAVAIQVVEGDFTQKMDLPTHLDGIVMANALHYVADPLTVLPQVLSHLRPGGSFVLIEYETQQARPPWIPYPLPQAKGREILAAAGLAELKEIGRVPSQYGHEHIYALAGRKA